MSGIATAVVASAVIGGTMASNASKSAAKKAASAQTESAQMGIDEQGRQFDALQALLKPYSDAGLSSLTQQQNLIGLNGNEAQQLAINGVRDSSQFGELAKQGENAILQNASATGGLRGGNVQAALAQFRPALLQQLLDQQFAKLGGITSLGQNAAAGTGNAGMQSANNISTLLQQQGAAEAGAALAGGRADAQMWNNLGSAGGLIAGRFGGASAPATTTAPIGANSSGFLGNGITGSAF